MSENEGQSNIELSPITPLTEDSTGDLISRYARNAEDIIIRNPEEWAERPAGELDAIVRRQKLKGENDVLRDVLHLLGQDTALENINSHIADRLIKRFEHSDAERSKP